MLYNWSVTDITSLNSGKGRLPYEVAVTYTENWQNETPSVIAKFQSPFMARAFASWYWANVAGATSITVR